MWGPAKPADTLPMRFSPPAMRGVEPSSRFTVGRAGVVGLSILVALVPMAGPAFARTKPKPKPKPQPVAIVVPPIPGADQNPLPAPLGVQSGILVDATNGKVLWSLNGTAVRAPASLTKIVTAMVVLQRANLNDTAVMTQDAADVEPSKIDAPAGSVLSVSDLLWGLLLASGNDAAIALAHHVSPDGTVAGFADLMNQEAAGLGATASHFVTPNGLDAPGHVTTARDLAVLTMAAMKDPTFAAMVGAVNHTITWGGGPHPLVNHNGLLSRFPGTIGVKTGFTNDAGSALDSEVVRNGTTLLAVVLGANTRAGYGDSEALYTWGFANLATLEAGATDTVVPKAPPALQAAAPAAAPVAAPDSPPLAAAPPALAPKAPSKAPALAPSKPGTAPARHVAAPAPLVEPLRLVAFIWPRTDHRLLLVLAAILTFAFLALAPLGASRLLRSARVDRHDAAIDGEVPDQAGDGAPPAARHHFASSFASPATPATSEIAAASASP